MLLPLEHDGTLNEPLGIDLAGLTAIHLASNNIKDDLQILPLHVLAKDAPQIANERGREHNRLTGV